MKNAAFRLLPVVVALGGCASNPPPPPAPPPPPPATGLSSAGYTPGVPGGISSESYSTTATVIAIDRNTRSVTLLQSDGSQVAFTAGPEVRNFDQINIGDHVTATLSTDFEISVRKAGTRVPQGEVTAAAIAKKGEKPGVVAVTAMQGSAKITKLDTVRREVTLQFSDGSTGTYPVRADVDMTKASVGDEVVFRSTEMRSIIVTQPSAPSGGKVDTGR
jgi:hypothetical protein